MRLLTLSAKVVIGAVAIPPVLLTTQNMSAMLTDSGNDVLFHPVTLCMLSFSTAYATTGDFTSSGLACIVFLLVAQQLLVKNPQKAHLYFDTSLPSNVEFLANIGVPLQDGKDPEGFEETEDNATEDDATSSLF